MSKKRKVGLMIIGIIFMIVAILTVIVGVNKREEKKHTTREEPLKWEWSVENTADGMKKYEGKYVEVEGYFAPYGDEEASLYYLSCMPQNQRMFEESNSGAYSVIALSFNEDQGIEYYEGPISVVGKVEYGTYGTDTNGYSYKYKIVDATYNVIDEEDIKDESTKKYYDWITEENSDLSILFSEIDLIGNTIYWKSLDDMQCEKIDIDEYTELLERLSKGDTYDKRFSSVARDALTLIDKVNEKIDNEELINEDIDSEKLLEIRVDVEKLYTKYIYSFEVFNVSKDITYDEFDSDSYIDEQVNAYMSMYNNEEESSSNKLDSSEEEVSE